MAKHGDSKQINFVALFWLQTVSLFCCAERIPKTVLLATAQSVPRPIRCRRPGTRFMQL